MNAVEQTSDADFYDHGTRMPVLFDPPRRPHAGPRIRVDEHTTPRKLVMRSAFAVPKYTVPGALLIVGHFVGEALVPVVMGVAIDRAIVPGNAAALAWWLVVLAVDFAFLSFTWRFGQRLAVYARSVVEHQLRMRVTGRILDPRGMAGPRRLPGVTLNIATSDVSRLSAAVFLGVFPVGQLAAVSVVGVILLGISWPLGVAILSGAPTLLWVLDRAGAPLRRRTENEQALAGEAAGTATDLVAGLRIVKGIGAEGEAERRYRTASGCAVSGAIHAGRSQGLYVGVMQMTASLFVVAVGVAAGLMAIHGLISIGELITVVGSTQFVMGPLTFLGTDFGPIWNGAVPAAVRVLSVLQNPLASRTGEASPRCGEIVFRGVGFGPLHDLDLVLPATGVTAIVCPPETTEALTTLLSRRAEPDEGVVEVGGVDLFDLAPAAARALVRTVPHTPDLFEGTVLENVAAAVPAESLEGGARISRALVAAGCDDIAEVLPAGLDTPVGEAGRMLSGGQRQRVSLARALAAESAFLVLTDPTTAVDPVTEMTVAGRLPLMREGAATIIFTGSRALLEVADRIVTIEGADVATPGGTASAVRTECRIGCGR